MKYLSYLFQKDDVDTRLEFMSEYLLKSLKQKIDKWNKFITGDERVRLFIFIEMDTWMPSDTN